MRNGLHVESDRDDGLHGDGHDGGHDHVLLVELEEVLRRVARVVVVVRKPVDGVRTEVRVEIVGNDHVQSVEPAESGGGDGGTGSG